MVREEDTYDKGKNGKSGTDLESQEVNADMEGLNEINAGIVILEQVGVNLGVTKSNAVVELELKSDDHVTKDVHDGPSKPKPKWTRIPRMDCGLENSSDEKSITILGKRKQTKIEEAEFNVEKEAQVLKRGKLHGDYFSDTAVGVLEHPC